MRTLKTKLFGAMAALPCGIALLGASVAQAQPVSPVTVTPQSLVPKPRSNGFHVEISETGALHPPVGAEGLSVTLQDVSVDGGFAEVADQINAVVAPLKGHKVTLAEIYATASKIEAIHAHAGYVLARVSVPAQELSDGGTLHIAVIDGFIEKVDVSGLPARVQGAVSKRTAKLVEHHHVTWTEIERALMVASEVPGLTMRSTLMHGDKPGGAKLVLEGEQRLLTGRIGVDNSMAASLGQWGVTTQLALNSALGLGEQFYGFIAGDYAWENWLGSRPRDRVLGAGLLMPFVDGTLSVNPEATFATTAPTAASNSPPTIGTLQRLTLRTNATLFHERAQQAGLSLTLEQLSESNSIPSMRTIISRDRYMALRFGGYWNAILPSDTVVSFNGQFSQGLGQLGGISPSQANKTGIPFSRQGARPDFTKLTVGGSLRWLLDANTSFRISAQGQTSFGFSVLRAEQDALEGPDGLSAYVGGRTAVDEGGVIRTEMARAFDLSAINASAPGSVSPYAFAAVGAGILNDPTSVEHRSLRAVNMGLGLRAALSDKYNLKLEYAYGLANYRPLDQSNRINVSVSVDF